MIDIQQIIWEQMTTDLRQVHVVDSKKPGEIFAREDVWLSVRGDGWNGMREGDIKVSVAPACGGAWYCHGDGHVHEDRVELKLQTISDIMSLKRPSATYIFEFCDPRFPDNMYEFFHRAAVNLRKAQSLKHECNWNRHSEDRIQELLKPLTDTEESLRELL